MENNTFGFSFNRQKMQNFKNIKVLFICFLHSQVVYGYVLGHYISSSSYIAIWSKIIEPHKDHSFII